MPEWTEINGVPINRVPCTDECRMSRMGRWQRFWYGVRMGLR